METREVKIKKAWSNYYIITNSNEMLCGNMICNKCKEKINGNYLIQDRTNYLLRGNENDKRYIFHRKCSEDNVNWKKFDEENKRKVKESQIKESQIKEVNDLIEKYGLSKYFERENDDY